MYKNVREVFSLTVISIILVLFGSYFSYYFSHDKQVQQEKTYIESVVRYMNVYCENYPNICQDEYWQHQLLSSVFVDEKIARITQYDQQGQLLWKSIDNEPYKKTEILRLPYDKYTLVFEYYSIDKRESFIYIGNMCLAVMLLTILLFEWYSCIFYSGEFLNFWLCVSLSKRWKEKNFSNILILPVHFLNNISQRAVFLLRQVNLQWFILRRKKITFDTIVVKKKDVDYIHKRTDDLVKENTFQADPFSSRFFWAPHVEGRWLIFLLTSMSIIQSYFLLYERNHDYLLWAFIVNLVGGSLSFLFHFLFNQAILLLFVNFLIVMSLFSIFYQFFNFACLFSWISCFSLFYSLRIVHKNYIYPDYNSNQNIIAGVLASLPFSAAVVLFFSGSNMVRYLFSFVSILGLLFFIYSMYFVMRHPGWLDKERVGVSQSLKGILKNSVNLHIFFLGSLGYYLLELGQYKDLSLSIVYLGMLFYIIYQSGAMIFQSRWLGIISMVLIVFSYIFSCYAFIFSYMIFFIGYGLIQEINPNNSSRLFFIDSFSLSLGCFFAFLCAQMAEKKYFFVSICFLWVVYHFYKLKNNYEKPL